VFTAEGSEESGSFAVLAGEVSVDDPTRYAADPEAQACAPGQHAAVWRLSLSALGLRLDTPVFFDRAADATAAARLVFCPPAPRTAESVPVAAPRSSPSS